MPCPLEVPPSTLRKTQQEPRPRGGSCQHSFANRKIGGFQVSKTGGTKFYFVIKKLIFLNIYLL